ncbi:MAG: LD-carboxypeptidase [Victivallales bacterium]|nr:LD-carboxypeptidase [Victivallales bacterium]
MTGNPFHYSNIGFFSLSGVCDEERLAVAGKRLRDWGVNAIMPRPAKHLRYLDGTDAERLRCFNELLANPDVEMMVALRGGFGVTRILDSIDWEAMRRRNLPIVGYSDVSALHLAAFGHGCCNHIHGPMLLSQFGKEPASEEDERNINDTIASLKACIEGNPCPILPDAQLQVIQEGHVSSAPIVPCNFSMLISLLGTPHLPQLKNTILAVEDISEDAYRVDRMLAQLKSAGILKSLKGLVFGDFTDCENLQYLPAIFAEYARFVKGPVISGLPFGHGRRTMSIKVGAFVELTAGKDGVTLKEAALNAFKPKMFCSAGCSQSVWSSIGYRLLSPRNCEPGKKYPLIMFLHGAGERGEDNTAQLVHVLPDFARLAEAERINAFIAAPQCPLLKQWVDTPWSLKSHAMPENMSRPLSMAMALLDELLATLPIDCERVCIMGISMGGYGTWDAIQRFPERFACAVPICGGGDVAQAYRLTKLPIWAFHGELDNLVPVCRTTDMIDALRKAGGTPKMTIYPDTYHDSWVKVPSEPGFLEWLQTHLNAQVTK